jgi:hypothetical protein
VPPSNLFLVIFVTRLNHFDFIFNLAIGSINFSVTLTIIGVLFVDYFNRMLVIVFVLIVIIVFVNPAAELDAEVISIGRIRRGRRRRRVLLTRGLGDEAKHLDEVTAKIGIIDVVRYRVGSGDGGGGYGFNKTSLTLVADHVREIGEGFDCHAFVAVVAPVLR